jgi:S-adenosylmethionine:tRNA ribosyltransferase-isomerase
MHDFSLPDTLIAARPASPRDAARLFVYDTARDTITFSTFARLADHLPPRSLLVFNDTKVVPARAILQKATGGKIELLFLVNEWDGHGPVPAIADRKIAVGAPLFFMHRRRPASAKNARAAMTMATHAHGDFTVVRQEENIFYLRPNFPAPLLLPHLEKEGITPIPKYIKGTPLSERALRTHYQTVFGAKPASIAAPTASLHFTERLLAKLDARGFRKTFITLHVGMGTFAPVTEHNLAQNMLHTEHLVIPAASRTLIKKEKEEGHPVVAVGTTVVRTLESQANAILKRGEGPIAGKTDIFIRPPYPFRIADAMITNFHLPGTSLMMLVEAFLRHKGAERDLVELYRIAIRERFRFYSFGDGMLII